MTADAFDNDDDVPWASPEIRASYEMALGQFILAFNEVDSLLTKVIETVVMRLNRKDLVNQCVNGQNFWLKLLVIDLLKSSGEGAAITGISIPLLKQLAGERNTLAHGHFDQNPFDGSFLIYKFDKNDRISFSVERLNDLTTKATEAAKALRAVSAYYFFEPPA